MKQKCIRCVVQLNLAEVKFVQFLCRKINIKFKIWIRCVLQLLWQDENEVNIHLEGPALFVRACVLGQLQHSQLHKPVFPVQLDQELTFDRVCCCAKSLPEFGHCKRVCVYECNDLQSTFFVSRFWQTASTHHCSMKLSEVRSTRLNMIPLSVVDSLFVYTHAHVFSFRRTC